jgi:hypothetical protein
MKKVLMVTMITLTSFIGFGQQKISGFGKLQLGMSVNDIPELTNSIEVKNSNDYIMKVYQNTSNKVYEVFADTTDKYNTMGSFDKRVRVFHLGNYNVTENINIKDVDLKFFNNKLYSIHVGDYKIDELLTTKYGEPKKDFEEKEKYYTNGYGMKITKKDQTFKHTYNTNIPNVECYYELMSWHDSKGEKLIVSFTILEDKIISDVVSKEVDMVKSRINKREEDKKKGLVSGF